MTDLSAAISAVRQERDATAARLAKLDQTLATLLELHGGSSVATTIESSTSPTERGPLSSLDVALKDAGSIKKAAEIILKDAGQPMKASEVADRLHESPFPYEYDRETLRRSVASQMARNCEEGDPFVRTGHGVYAARSVMKEKNPPDDEATEQHSGAPAKRSNLEPAEGAAREEEASNTSLPRSDGS